MVTNISLEDQDVERAKNLLKVMDKTGIKPESFLWYYLSDNQAWRLVISSSKFNNKSISDNYKEFINRFKSNKYVREIGLENVTLVDSSDDLIKLLKTAIKTNPHSISGIKFKSSNINNTYIDDAYIYRLS